MMEHVITAAEDGRRLRDVLRQVMGVSYSAMKSAKWDGRITVDGIATPVDAFVREGQTVCIRFKDAAPVYTIKPYHLPLVIPYEDEHFWMIDKPAPLPSAPSASQSTPTLENALYSRRRSG